VSHFKSFRKTKSIVFKTEDHVNEWNTFSPVVNVVYGFEVWDCHFIIVDD
jgi:hypothetical protein